MATRQPCMVHAQHLSGDRDGLQHPDPAQHDCMVGALAADDRYGSADRHQYAAEGTDLRRCQYQYDAAAPDAPLPYDDDQRQVCQRSTRLRPGGFFESTISQAFSQTFVDVQRLRTKQAVWATLLLCLSVAANTFAFYYSLQQTIDDVISIGNILILVQSLAVIQRQLGDLAEFGASGLFENLLYMNRLFRFLDLEPDLPIAESVQPVPQRLTNGIRLEKVGFNYPDGRTALKDISLTIEPGQVVAIVGENGAGKTTLVKLLSRFTTRPAVRSR